MHFVVLVVLVVAVCGRDVSDAGYYPAQPYGRHERHHINSPPPEVTEVRHEENNPNRGNYESFRPVDLNNNRQVVNYEYDRELSNNDRNGRRHHLPNTDRHPHGIRNMDINLAFEREGPIRQRDEKNNLPKQSFSINDEYSKRVDVSNNDNSRRYNKNLPTQRDDGGMVFRNDDEDDHDKRKTPVIPDNNNSNNNDVPNTGIISFLSNVDIGNTNNNNNNSNKQIGTQPNDSNNNQVGLKSGTVINGDQQPPKTTVENKVTPNPFNNDPIANTTSEEKWIWGGGDTPDVESTTVMTTLDDLDNRVAFDGSKCASGSARVQGKCVPTD